MTESFVTFVQINSAFFFLKEQVTFENLKALLAKKPVVKIFDPRKEIVVTTDASECSISGILTYDGHLVYLLRKLSNAEVNYSNIEEEVLVIIWMINRAHQFLSRKKFLLRSNHRPLEFIFNPRKELPKVTSSRILR